MAETSRDDLKLAFAWHVAREIMDADLEVAEGEVQWLAKHFPADALSTAGFTDASGDPTERYHSALGQALVQLPEMLEGGEKKQLLGTFFSATLADDEFKREEATALVKAAKLLGLSMADLDSFLESHDDVGSLDLPEPE